MAIATANKNNGRQWPLVARQAFTLAEMEDGVAIEAIDLPIGSIVLSGTMVITEVFDSTTSDTIEVTGGGAPVGATTVQATGLTDLVPTGVEQTLGDTVDLTWTSGGGTPTTGAGYVEVMYIITSRANENQP